MIMEEDSPVIYGLELQARALTSQVAETEAIRFVVGTQSLKYDNQIHLIDVDDENNVINKNVYSHRGGEVWSVSASPKDKDVIATCYTKTTDSKCQVKSSIWKFPTDCESSYATEENPATASLELLCELGEPTLDGDTKCVLWHPSDGQSVITLVDNCMSLLELGESATQAKAAARWSIDGKGYTRLTAGAWNPHQNCAQISTANDTCIRGWDVRCQKQIYIIESAHGTLVRDLNFNPNKQYHIASCGDDCKVKFWDYRNLAEPLKVIDNHSHWVWCVRFNHFHDQLVLSSSSDSRVILHNVSSISSEPLGHLNEDDANSDGSDTENQRMNKSNEDGVIATFEEHEDSVYAVEWSMADPWLFASLSYDGRLIINKVPKAIKYKILL